MPELISIHELHAKHRDKFAIITIHDKSIKSFAELDEKLVAIKSAHWQNKDLPFPILIDTDGKNVELFGITSWPTGILIDPEGNVVKEVSPKELEAKLPPIGAAEKWLVRRDMSQNVGWSTEPETTFADYAESFSRFSLIEVQFSDDVLESRGFKANYPIPAMVNGYSITLRSLEELTLIPHGFELGQDLTNQKLVLKKYSGESKRTPAALLTVGLGWWISVLEISSCHVLRSWNEVEFGQIA
ncbi:MAG: hypothetical protein ABL888_09690 [Pirellulaceae bacterium]